MLENDITAMICNEIIDKEPWSGIKANETKVMIKRTGEIGTVIGIGYNMYGDYVAKVKIPYGHNNNCYVNTYDLTDIMPYKKNAKYTCPSPSLLPNIKAVYFNDPLTCVIWEDGVKTFVKNVDGALKYDKEKALAMAISKKALGNKYNYYKEFEKWLPEEDAKFAIKSLSEASSELRKSFSSFKIISKEYMNKRMALTKNPVEKAYLALLKVNDDPTSKDADFAAAIEEAIGYLGEALDD